MPPVHMFLHRFRLSVRDLFFRSDRYTEDLQSQADKTDCRSALHALPDSPGQFRFLQIRFLIYRYINRISIFHRSHPRILSQKFRNLRIIPCGIFWHQKYYHDNNDYRRNTAASCQNVSCHPVSARFLLPTGCRYSIHILTRIRSGGIAEYKCTNGKNKNNHCQQTGNFLPGLHPAAKQQMIDQACCSA